MPQDAPFSLGPWTVDPAANEVRRGAEVVRLEPKAVAVLAYLAAHAGEVVSREALLDAVWPDVVVTDASLTRCVSQLRQALGDDARGAGLIETIPKVGYRLHIAPAEVRPAHASPEPPPRSRRWALVGLAVVAVLATAAALWPSAPGPLTVEYRVDTTGVVEDAEVTLTNGTETIAEAVDGAGVVHLRRTVEATDTPPATFRLTLRGRSAGTEVVLAVIARRGGEVVAEHTTTGATVAEAPEAFSFYAEARVED